MPAKSAPNGEHTVPRDPTAILPHAWTSESKTREVSILTTSIIMPTIAKTNNVRKRRDKQFEVALKHLRESIEDSDQPTASHITSVSVLQSQLQYAWQRFQSCQQELDDLDDEDLAQEEQAWKDHTELGSRLQNIADKRQLSTYLIES